MQSQARPLVSPLRIIVLAAVSALLIASAALPMTAQNSVPPTARQAATIPQFAAKLAHGTSRISHPVQPRASYKKSANTLAPTKRGWLPQDNNLYDNGPINGTTDAWTINFGFVTSDTFTVPQGGGPANGLTFGAWLFPGDLLQTVEVQITSAEFGGTTYSDQVVTFTQSGCSASQYGFNVCTETGNFATSVNLAAGTYWVNLDNAVVNTGDPVYWDENSGAGCDSPGCPSQASENSVGTIPSEAFTVLGGTICIAPEEEKPATAAKAVTVPPSPTQSYRVIYNFTGGGDGGAPSTGLVIDAAGNLYGTTGGGGPLGGGTAFKLSPSASGWRFDRLYSFPGANGGPDSTLVLRADGTLLGTTYGGQQGDGTLYDLSPLGHISPTVFSNWMETLLYSFTGGSDGAHPGKSLVLDSSGNIFGTTNTGGVNAYGTLYELTNSGLQVLHAFPAFHSDGITPIGVVNGSDGLYGLTSHGGGYGTGTLYTTEGGYQVLHSFGPYQLNGGPTSLAADQAGNLYGADSFRNCFLAGANVSQFSPPGWDPVTLISFTTDELSSWVSTDALGNVYGTTDFGGQNLLGNVFKLTCCWNYSDLHDFSGYPTNDGFQPVASPVVDAQGNIYGTTLNGGTYGFGVVWEISP